VSLQGYRKFDGNLRHYLTYIAKKKKVSCKIKKKKKKYRVKLKKINLF